MYCELVRTYFGLPATRVNRIKGRQESRGRLGRWKCGVGVGLKRDGRLEAWRWKISGEPRACNGCLCRTDTKRKAEGLAAGTGTGMASSGTLRDGASGTAENGIGMPVPWPGGGGRQGILPDEENP